MAKAVLFHRFGPFIKNWLTNPDPIYSIYYLHEIFKIYTGFVLVTAGIFLVGPTKKFEPAILLDTDINTGIAGIEKYVAEKESKVKDLKPNNQARIIWANDSLKQKTE